MVLAGQAAAPGRALAMGVYLTISCVGMGVAPAIAGFRDVSHAAAPLWMAVAMVAGAVLSLAGYRAARRIELARF